MQLTYLSFILWYSCLEFGNWSDWENCTGQCGWNATRTRNRTCFGDNIPVDDPINCTKSLNETCQISPTGCPELMNDTHTEICYMKSYPCYSK